MNLINELRMLAEDLYVNGYNRYSAAMSKAADELGRLAAKLEAAGKDVAIKEGVIDSLAAVVKRLDAQCDAAEKAVTESYQRGYETGQEEIAAELEFAKREVANLHDDIHELIDERDALRAKIERMEQQEPVGHVYRYGKDSHGRQWHGIYWYDPNLDVPTDTKLYTLPGAQPAPSVPNLNMDALERQNDWLREEVCRLREGLALIADQYEPKCSLLIPSIARTALNATGAYGQKESPESWPTEAMVTAFAELFNVRDQKNTFGPAFRAALAAAPEAKP